ncbi:two-component system, LytT family, sensor kinase [Malonomonas rubra DSM 5091]|uniref:histidine kinase n=1 Tax=Malonomonas rubra DSM 5091 TaxID=1122189 RepID=A0A1M6GKE6_MALRU|nr:sensor histidine kinase [Malonomonas rubra]SHJ10399.1 two-component system, LytT family, sensor kinase [Malonomonas rubra DSM 5091]
MPLIFELLQQMAMIVVIAYLFSKSPAMNYLTGERLRNREKLILYFTFTLFSILGTYTGLPIQGAIANTRAIGAVLAGLIGGPALGVSVGLTAGIHRFSLGGFTAFSCGISTTTEGLIGGLIHLWLMKKNNPEQVFQPAIAFGATFVAEVTQMVLILLLSRPFSDALALVEMIALPMILANSVGAALFISMVRDQKRVRDKVGAMFSSKAFTVADRTLGILSRGFSSESAKEMVEIIRQETGVGAVAITDREKILAFAGIGDDHHRPGNPVVTKWSQLALSENKVVFANGYEDHFQCPLTDDCPIGSVLVVPLQMDQEVVGTISLYEPKTKLFLSINRSFGEGLATLYSHQLLRSRYEEQKSLLVRSELKLIQAQVNPHFLFNALNTIRAVVRKDSDRARDLLLELSNFFRTNLKRTSDTVTLEEEIAHSGAYLEIEKARFGKRLVVEMEIDPQLKGLRVPAFTLQPLIENAVKHGVASLLDQGYIWVRAYQQGRLALIEVEDNAGCYCKPLESQGLGMKLVDKRVKNLYGNEAGLSVECVPQEKTLIRVTIPQDKGQFDDSSADC